MMSRFNFASGKAGRLPSMYQRRQTSSSSARQLTRAVKASKVPAISRAAAVLRLLGKSDAPLGVQAVARELGVVPSTCLNVLRTLVAEQFVSFDPDTKHYTLEAGLLTLARHWLKRNRFSDLAQPVLSRISQDFNLTVAGVHIVDYDHFIVVAVSQSTSDFQLTTHVGSRFPTLISATGRCAAAFGNLSEDDLRTRFGDLTWAKAPSFDEWRAQVQQTFERGYAVDEGNHISGVTVVAAPVHATRSRLTHAIVALGLSTALQGKELTRLQRAVRSSAQILSSRLCGEMVNE
jgi:DNA-binding IclR family transcriptional regulator